MNKRSAMIAMLCAVAAGCGRGGPDRGFVEGVVTLDGTPLSDAQVEFTPERGRPSVGMTDSNGWYYLRLTRSLDGAYPGEHTVRILTEPGYTKNPGDKVRRVPRIYNAQTTLTATVELGDNEINWDLTTPEQDGAGGEGSQ